MGETLEALHRLQVVELQLAAIRRNREIKVRRVESAKRQLKQAEDRLKERQLAARERQARIDGLSLEVASREESIAKHREGLNKAKSNKEYSAILAAMNTEKADNSKIESKILELMEETQKIQAELSAAEAERDRARAGVASAESSLADYDAGTKSQSEQLMSTRAEHARVIAPTTLSSFLRVAEHHEGEAMAPVMRMHPRREDFICSGCNINVTLEVVNSLQTRDEVQLCPSCGRILYFPPSPAKS